MRISSGRQPVRTEAIPVDILEPITIHLTHQAIGAIYPTRFAVREYVALEIRAGIAESLVRRVVLDTVPAGPTGEIVCTGLNPDSDYLWEVILDDTTPFEPV